MGLSSDLLNSFAKITNDSSKKKTESVVYGTVTEYPTGSGNMYVQLDGAANDMLTPYEPTVEVSNGQRVAVTIKNHTATVNGNISSPAATIGTTDNIIAQNATITGKLTAAEAEIDDLYAKKASIDELKATNAEIDNLKTITANIGTLEANIVNVNTQLTATNGKINNLEATYADFEQAYAEHLEANNAVINSLDTNYANIDFANVGDLAADNLFAKSSFIQDLTLETGVVVKELVGVKINGDVILGNTIVGDSIQGNTITADKLLFKGDDGLYYQLLKGDEGLYFQLNKDALGDKFDSTKPEMNTGIHGNAIIAASITTEKLSADVLTAFKASIGGFQIDGDSIYSHAKPSSDATTQGVYLGNDGSFYVGDGSEYLRYVPEKDDQGNPTENYKLEIQAENIKIGTGHKNIQTAIQEEIDSLTVGGTNLFTNTKDMSGVIVGDDTVAIEPDTDEFNKCHWSALSDLPETPWRALSLRPEMTLDSEHAFGKEFTISFMYRSDQFDEIRQDTDSNTTPILISIGARDDTVDFPNRTRWRDVFGIPEESKKLFTSGDWQKFSYTFTFGDDVSWLSRQVSDDSGAVSFFFQIWNHSMYDLEIKQIKLEYGNTATDWSPAAEDIIATITNKYKPLEDNVADLLIANGEIHTKLQGLSEGVNDELGVIKNKLDLAITPDKLALELQNIHSNGVTTNTYYTFNDHGLDISKSDKSLSTQITEDGMRVIQDQNYEKPVLQANANGVVAKNLNASTYLIIGSNSRFETYNWNRTGCFWIGG